METNQSRAARFEDEKRRIIDSCFSKRDGDGMQLESYITHVRVLEDAAYPSSPPPPDSSDSNKKHRLILVAVRRSGKVRVHKARENPNGSFSIGKTWNLDELTAIISYTSLMPANLQQQMEKEWASDTGFVVSLGKPYFWAAPTSKEKDFFIASLIKIYRKYTGGKSPELIGLPQISGMIASQRTPETPAGHSELGLQPAPLRPSTSSTSPATPATPPISAISTPSPATTHADVKPKALEPAFVPKFEERRPGLPPVVKQKPFNEDFQPDMLGSAPGPIVDEYRPALSPAPRVDDYRPSPPPAPRVDDYRPSPPPAPMVDEYRPSPPPAPRVDDYRPSPSPIPAPIPGLVVKKKSFNEDAKPKVVEPPAVPKTDEYRPGQNSIAQKKSFSDDVKSSEVTEPMAAPRVEDHRPGLGAMVKPTISHDEVKPEVPEPVADPKVEEHRPGLGPMVKKKSTKDIANQFRKAALAATAFQPRQGGAGARLKAMQEKLSNEPDGITSVVPAPLTRGMSVDGARSGTPDLGSPVTENDQFPSQVAPVEALPRVKIERTGTSDSVARSATPVLAPVTAEPEQAQTDLRSDSPDRTRAGSPQRKRRQKMEAEVEKQCASLGIDPRIMEGRGADFNELLTEFGWDGKLSNLKTLYDFETDIQREIGRAQATGWLGIVEQQDSKIQDLAKAFDKTIAECEELDGLLTLYAHELDTLHDDIEYIEAQGQGLQVQTANQKLLQSELQSLLKTLTISSADLRALQSAPIDNYDGVRAVEHALALLYRAMVTIDPEIRQNKLRQAAAASANWPGVGVYADTELGQMKAVRQKKEDYKDESMMFVNRFNQHMKAMFHLAEQRTSEENATASISSGTSATLNLRAYNASRQELWIYNVMMLFVREVNQYEWQTLISSYEINVKSIYQDQFREYVMGLRKTVRIPTGEEQEILFTHQDKEKQDESLTSTAARKLTVKRGRTVKTSGLRQSIGEKREGKPDAWMIFDTVLEQQSAAIAEEQNFLVQFFHLDSQSNADFVDVVQSRPPEQRKLPNLQAKQAFEPDRNLAKIVQNTTEGIYSFWPTDLQALMEWVFKLDQLQGIGVLVSLEQCLAKYEETNQEFITRTVRTLHERLTGLFHKFIEEQVKAIEETKVKVKKRRGLISFMKVFPEFTSAVEDMIPPESAHQSLEVRFTVNDAYIKLLKAMWESLNFIAKDHPSTGGGDPEDKEALNYHVLLIENMTFFVSELQTNHNVVLDEWVERASRDQLTHLSQYVDAVIRRPLGKWLDFLEGTEALLKSSDYANIANKPSHSRSSAKKILAAYDAKEIRKGVDTLKKRIEKHFTDLDDPLAWSSKTLISQVLDECATRYAHAYDRMKLVIERVYSSSLEIDWRKEDVAALLKR